MLRSRSRRPVVYADADGLGHDAIIQKGAEEFHVLYKEHNRLQLGPYKFALDFVLRPEEYRAF